MSLTDDHDKSTRPAQDSMLESISPAAKLADPNGVSRSDSASDDAIAADAVKLKGRANGVMIELGDGDWPALLVALNRRLESAVGFFRGGQVALEVGRRSLREEELRQFCNVLERYDLTLGAVRSESTQTFDAALQMGLASALETAGDAPRIDAMPAVSDETETGYFVYRGGLRSGQILERDESIILLGDVNPGARVISGGDIYIWGRLRGIAHAGAQGDPKALITALGLDEAIQLRIGESVAVAPKDKTPAKGGRFWRRNASATPKESGPQIALMSNGRIIVGLWHELKPGSSLPAPR